MKTVKNQNAMNKMTNKLRTLGAAIFCAAALAACSSDDDIIDGSSVKTSEKQVYTMTVQATKSTSDDPETRALSLEGKTLKVKWNEGETVYVMDGGVILGTLTAAASDNATTTLKGEITASSKPVWIDLYLHDYNMVYTGQTGVLLKPAEGTDNSIETNYDFARVRIETSAITWDETSHTVTVDGSANFTSHQAIVKFSLYQSDGTTPINAKSLTLTTSGNILKFLNYQTNATDFGKEFELTGLSGTTNDIYVAISNYTGNKLTLTATDASSNTYTYTKESVGRFQDGKYYEVKVTMTNTAPLTVEAVDLGLSVKWANMNVGAESVTDRGLYFAWGETTGHAFGSGYKFSLDNYAWYNSTDKFTKYKHDGSSWDYEELASEDDAAAKIWGGVWRIPTKAEWEELLNEDNCTWTWTTDYKGDGTNVAGVIVTSKKDGYTDKSIFLPATGSYSGDNNTGSEIWATYWSKSLFTDNDGTDHAPNYHYDSAWRLEILYNAGSLVRRRVHNENRYCGIGVRAVCP